MAKKKSKPVKKVGMSTQAWIGVFAGLIVAVGIIGGVLGWVVTKGNDTASAAPKPPDFAYASTAPKGAAEAYQFALDNPDVLAQIPCYCGCGQEANHKNNLDCYIKSRDGNNVSFDSHGAG